MGDYDQVEPPAKVFYRANNPNKGGRPVGSKDTQPRKPTHKTLVVEKAARWHVEQRIENLSVTENRFFEEYSQGMTVSRRHFRSKLRNAIAKIES